jgi:Flp pilus assembly CpaF family ATPase
MHCVDSGVDHLRALLVHVVKESGNRRALVNDGCLNHTIRPVKLDGPVISARFKTPYILTLLNIVIQTQGSRGVKELGRKEDSS